MRPLNYITPRLYNDVKLGIYSINSVAYYVRAPVLLLFDKSKYESTKRSTVESYYIKAMYLSPVLSTTLYIYVYLT